jgi:hypothetical protein
MCVVAVASSCRSVMCGFIALPEGAPCLTHLVHCQAIASSVTSTVRMAGMNMHTHTRTWRDASRGRLTPSA